jgi:hypothetical protein
MIIVFGTFALSLYLGPYWFALWFACEVAREIYESYFA